MLTRLSFISMGACIKFYHIVSFLICVLIVNGCKGNISEQKSKYPESFPPSCVSYFDKWDYYLKKMKNSGRFDKGTLLAFDSHREAVIFWVKADLERDINVFYAKMDRYCKLEEREDSLFKPLDNMKNLNQEELEKAIHVDSIKKNQKRRKEMQNGSSR